jgi:hypothetical protein
LWQSRNVARKVVQGPHLTDRPGVEGYTMPPFPDGSLTKKAPTYMVGTFILNPGVSPGTRVAWRTLSGRRLRRRMGPHICKGMGACPN